MNTTTGVFGEAAAFCRPGAGDALSSDGLGAIRRHLQGLFAQGGHATATTSPRLSVTGGARAVAPRAVAVREPIAAASSPAVVRTAAQDLVDDVRDRSGLVLEEVASLLRTSRRTVQNWRAGEAISSANERRLRDLAEAVGRIDAGDAEATRRRLFDRAEGEVRPFDLLAEGRFNLAVQVATGTRRRAEPRVGEGVRADVAARLSPSVDIAPVAAGVPSGRRLRRRQD